MQHNRGSTNSGIFADAEEDLTTAEEEEILRFSGYRMQRPDRPLIPKIFTSLPVLYDPLKTVSSKTQDLTVRECLPFLTGSDGPRKSVLDVSVHGVPHLDLKGHIAFLHGNLGELSSKFVTADASRPWMIYWSLTGLHLLGEDVSSYRERVVSTLTPMRNRDGGFGGGPGQLSHLAATYPAILSLVMVGGDEALGIIDRKMLWKWLANLKQRDGGFKLFVGGEEDVRGAYCAMVLISLLDLPIDLPSTSDAKLEDEDTLVTRLPEYLSRCQTFEGGISGLPGAEAHGAYAFCALACLCILGKPSDVLPRYLDLPLLISWLSSRQYAPEGGFSGRTNKLVDGCYSHWVGACWPLIEAALNGPQENAESTSPVVGSLYCREGLVRYVLCCCQAKRGGLRDKPSKLPDAYHTCYILAGLSSAQHYYYFSRKGTFDASIALSSAFHWEASEIIPTADGRAEDTVFDEKDRVRLIHPVYVLPWGVAESVRTWFNSQPWALG
ncbi:MAG: CAAX farnesyltransferase (FTase) subunit beta [Geoglossum simile]|nr:MAG: CAAX farnesyltransferase (FTase) subunit beta [Geoglossum simile]